MNYVYMEHHLFIVILRISLPLTHNRETQVLLPRKINKITRLIYSASFLTIRLKPQ